MREQPWATPILLLALGVAFAAIFGRVQPMVFGDTSAKRLPHPPALLPVFAHLGLVLMLGFYIPPYLADWYRAAARLIGGARCTASWFAERRTRCTGSARADVSRGVAPSRRGHRGRRRPSAGAVGEPGARRREHRARGVHLAGRDVRRIEPAARRPAQASYPGIERSLSSAARMQRAAADLSGVFAVRGRPAPVAAPRRLAGRLSSAGRRRTAASPAAAAIDDYAFVRVRGRRRARDPGRARARGDHRTGPFPLLGGRREGAAARRAPRLRAQGNRAALHRTAAPRGPPPGGARLGRFRRRVSPGPIARRSRAWRERPIPRARRVAPGSVPRARAPRQPSRRSRRARQRRGLCLRPRPVLPSQGAAAARDHPGARTALSHGSHRAGGHARGSVDRLPRSCCPRRLK